MNNTDIINQQQNFLHPESVLDHLNKNVIGQEAAKQNLSIAIANHINMLLREDIKIPKQNTIIIGNSGTGKTLLMQELGGFVKETAGIHVSISDATKLTEDGYSGLNTSDIVAQLLAEAGNDIDVAQKSIIYIDEIDKLMYDPNQNPKGRVGVFNSLLKIIEGAKVQLSESSIQVDTTGILFIVGGVFEKLYKNEVEKRKTIGFCRDIDDSKSKIKQKKEEKKKVINATRMIDIGLPIEFVGRFNIITKLDDMSKVILREILHKKVIPSYKSLFELYNMQLHLSKNEIEKIINEAYLSKSGARGLNNALQYKFRCAIFNQNSSKRRRLCNWK